MAESIWEILKQITMKLIKRFSVILMTGLFVFGIHTFTFAEGNKDYAQERRNKFPIDINFESPQYAILTENYQISYEKDVSGNIVMSKEDYEEMTLLLNDRETMKKL